jgi:hypothetical protein
MLAAPKQFSGMGRHGRAFLARAPRDKEPGRSKVSSMTDSPPHDWFRPKLAALVAEAEQAGIARDVSVAVITDLINGPCFNTAAPAANEDWNRDIGEPEAFVGGTLGRDGAPPRGGAIDRAAGENFIQPERSWRP